MDDGMDGSTDGRLSAGLTVCRHLQEAFLMENSNHHISIIAYTKILLLHLHLSR